MTKIRHQSESLFIILHSRYTVNVLTGKGEKNMRLLFLLLAMLAVGSMAAIGIFIAEQNVPMTIASVVLMIVAMGAGFVLKARLRKQA